jgi:hypothetical protein
MEESKTLEVLVTNGLISKRTATKQLIENFGITDFEEELKAIQKDNSNLLKEGETIKKVINI